MANTQLLSSFRSTSIASAWAVTRTCIEVCTSSRACRSGAGEVEVEQALEDLVVGKVGRPAVGGNDPYRLSLKKARSTPETAVSLNAVVRQLRTSRMPIADLYTVR